MNFDKLDKCPVCNHNIEEYQDRNEWICCPFCGM